MGKISAVPDDDYRIWMLLHQVSDGVSRAREKELRPFGISRLHAGVMFILKASDEPCTLAEISKYLFRKHHSVSEMVTRMERKGLVRRVRNPDGKGLVRVALTKKGEKLFRQQNKERKVIHRIMSCLSPEERENFSACLERLRKVALEELVVRPELFP